MNAKLLQPVKTKKRLSIDRDAQKSTVELEAKEQLKKDGILIHLKRYIFLSNIFISPQANKPKSKIINLNLSKKLRIKRNCKGMEEYLDSIRHRKFVQRMKFQYNDRQSELEEICSINKSERKVFSPVLESRGL